MACLCCFVVEASAAVPVAFSSKAASEPGIGLGGNEVGDIVYTGTHLWVTVGPYVCKLIGSGEGAGEEATDWERYDYGPTISGESASALCIYGDTIWIGTAYTTTYQGDEIPAGNGLYLSKDGGLNWQHFETEDIFVERKDDRYPDNITVCYDIVFDGQTVWASYTAGFLVKTNDEGATWERILPNTEELDVQNPNHYGQSVIVYNDTLWVGTFAGINRSVDAGAIWINNYGGGNLMPVTEDKDGDYPKMALVKALKLAEEKKGYLNLFANAGKGSRISVTGGASEEF